MSGERICAICGKTYVSVQYNAKYCSDECKDEGRRRKNKENRDEKKKDKNAVRKENANKRKTIVNIAAEAKKAGMSYGLYVAQMGL